MAELPENQRPHHLLLVTTLALYPGLLSPSLGRSPGLSPNLLAFFPLPLPLPLPRPRPPLPLAGASGGGGPDAGTNAAAAFRNFFCASIEGPAVMSKSEKAVGQMLLGSWKQLKGLEKHVPSNLHVSRALRYKYGFHLEALHGLTARLWEVVSPDLALGPVTP